MLTARKQKKKKKKKKFPSLKTMAESQIQVDGL